MLEIGTQTGWWLSLKDPEGSMKNIRDWGFETVDLGFDQVGYDAKSKMPAASRYDLPQEEFTEPYMRMKAAADANGVSVAQAHAPFPIWIAGEEAYNAAVMKAVKMVMHTCAAVGCPAVVVHPVTLSDKTEEWELNMRLYRELTLTARETGVKICLENLFTVHTGRVLEGACGHAEEAVRYIDTLNEEAGADLFGFCFDVGHANLLHKDICRYIETLGNRLTVLHIHDNDGQNDLHMAPYTQTRYYKSCTTALNWEQFITGLNRIGYRGALCFETFRVTALTPRPLWGSALGHIANIGRYFRDRILSENDTDI